MRYEIDSLYWAMVLIQALPLKARRRVRQALREIGVGGDLERALAAAKRDLGVPS